MNARQKGAIECLLFVKEELESNKSKEQILADLKSVEKDLQASVAHEFKDSIARDIYYG